MKPSLTILPLSNAHRDVAAALILPIQQEEFNVPITLADQPDLLDLEGAYFRPGGHFWGAFVDEELAGTIGLLAPANVHFGVIRKMFVNPSTVEGRGVSPKHCWRPWLPMPAKPAWKTYI